MVIVIQSVYDLSFSRVIRLVLTVGKIGQVIKYSGSGELNDFEKFLE